MNFLFPQTKVIHSCVRCNLVVEDWKELFGGLCYDCNKTDVDKLNKYKEDKKNNFNKLLKLVESDRDILIVWLINNYSVINQSKYGFNPANEIEQIIMNIKENI
jgi:hypothetical protein